MNYFDWIALREEPEAEKIFDGGDVIEFEPLDPPGHGIEVTEQRFDSFDELWAHIVSLMASQMGVT